MTVVDLFYIYVYDLFNDAVSCSVLGYTDPGRLIFCTVAFDIFEALRMVLASCQPSGA